MTDGIVLRAEKIVKRFPGVVAVDQVDFTLRQNEIYAVVGENGAGKSTLIKILARVYKEDSGSIFINGEEVTQESQIKNSIAYVPQELNLFPHLTVAENIFIPIQSRKGLTRKHLIDFKKLNQEARNILSSLGISIDPKIRVKELDVANQQMTQIARAISQDFSILILDEPTSSISYKEVEILFNVLRRIKSQGKSIIYITHKIDELYKLVDRVMILRDGRLIGVWNIDEINRDAIVGQMAGRRLARVELNKNKDLEKGEIVLKVENLSGLGFKNANLHVHEGEILGLAGLVGAGRTEIAKTIVGILPKKSGKIFINETEKKIQNSVDAFKNGLIYVSEERKDSGIFSNLSVKENITLPILKRFSFLNIISRKKQKAFVKSIITRFKIKVSSLEQKVRFLSGGNQQRLIIGRSVSVRPKIIIFDEPTKGIDVNAKAEVYVQLEDSARRGLGIIIISSEMEEIIKVSDRILVIHEGKIVKEFKGSSASREELLRAAMGFT